jgi:tRNA pseudouridine32 synthase/23S rRNA pseudouridine746 synthase
MTMLTSSGPERSWAALRASWLVFEDEAVLALNKPAGIPVIGERGGVDLLALARGGGEILRPVHRIDRVTSGLVLFAKEPRAHASLSRQLARRTLERTYLAIVRSGGLPTRGTIDLPLTAGRKGRVRVAAPRASIAFDAAHQRWSVASAEILADRRIYPSLTLFARVWESADHTLVVVRPITGRRHQIRVHFAWIGYPVEGDPLFPVRDAPPTARTCLHSWRLAFDAEWRNGERITIEAAPGEDFWEPLHGSLPFPHWSAVLERAHRAAEELAEL